MVREGVLGSLKGADGARPQCSEAYQAQSRYALTLASMPERSRSHTHQRAGTAGAVATAGASSITLLSTTPRPQHLAIASSHLGDHQGGQLAVAKLLVLIERLNTRDGAGYLEPEVVHAFVQKLEGVNLQRIIVLLQQGKRARCTGAARQGCRC